MVYNLPTNLRPVKRPTVRLASSNLFISKCNKSKFILSPSLILVFGYQRDSKQRYGLIVLQ